MTLVGRTAEAARLASWAAQPGGPITIWGPAGIGKSTLVREVLPDWRHVDARNLCELPDQPRVVWDGVDPEVARSALKERSTHVVLTTYARLGLTDERALGLGPLATEDARALLRGCLARTGRTLESEDLRVVAASVDGLPAALVEAARWLDVVGVDGLTDWVPRGWHMPAQVPPHLEEVFASLDRPWQRLQPSDRVALGSLAMVEGTITLELATALIGAAAFERLRTLREQGWLALLRPGALHMLKPIRAYVLQRAAPSQDTVERFADWVYERAAADAAALDASAVLERTDHLDDLDRVTRHRPSDARLPAALTVLTHARPTTTLDVRVDEALQRDPRSVPLLRSRCRLHLSAGELEQAKAVIEVLLEVADARVRGACYCVLGSIAQQTHRFDQAHARFLEAVETSASAGDDRGAAFARGNLAALAHDAGTYEEACELYAVALESWQRLGDRAQAALVRSNLALVHAAQGHTDRAIEELSEVLDTPGLGAPFDAAVRGSLGWVHFLAGRPDEAEPHLRQAVAALAEHQDTRTEATLVAQRAAVLCSLGRVAAADGLFDRAELILDDSDEYRTRRLVSLLRGFRDVAVGRQDDALARLAAARRGGPSMPPLVQVSDDARSAADALEAQLVSSTDEALLVVEDGATFRMPHAEPVSIQRFAAASSMLRALVDARIERPGHALDVPQLFAIGWPDEQIQERSMRNRVHVALSKLRAAGLREVLLRGDAGYLLDPQLQVLLVGRAWAA